MTIDELLAALEQSDVGREMIRRCYETMADYRRRIDEHVVDLGSRCPVVFEVTGWNLFNHDCGLRQEVQGWIVEKGDDRWDWFHAGCGPGRGALLDRAAERRNRVRVPASLAQSLFGGRLTPECNWDAPIRSVERVSARTLRRFWATICATSATRSSRGMPPGAVRKTTRRTAMGHARYPRRDKFWSKLKSRVEALWVPDLPMAIHCSVRKVVTTHWTLDEPHHWIVLNKEVIWDTSAFLRNPDQSGPPRGRRIETFEDMYWGPNGTSVVADLLRQYIDRSRNQLFEPFEMDGWELTEILRAADRRLGREALLGWAEDLDEGHPALKVLVARYGAERGPGYARRVPQAETARASLP
jgi:hypothetical protein